MNLFDSVYLPVGIIVFTFILSYCIKCKIKEEQKSNIFYTGKYEKRVLFIWCVLMLYLLLF